MTAPRITPSRTALNPLQEKFFRQWYAERAARAGIDPNPDNPLHRYDYRGAFLAQAEPAIDQSDGRYHWPSAYKDDDHPNRFVQGVGDTRAVDRGQLSDSLLAILRPRAAPADATRVGLLSGLVKTTPESR